jgi:hypothetical protein
MPDDFAPDPSPADSPDARPRRAFLARLAGVLAVVPVLSRHLSGPRHVHAAHSSSSSASQPNGTLLAALGAAVLPAELGAEGTRLAVADFQRWMDGYRPGAEANHGYGTGTIQRLPADPRPRWRTQLAVLDADARRAHGRSFPALTLANRQAIVRAALTAERGESLPTAASARHIAVAMLAHFYDSTTATDLCYEARIGRQQCRLLAAGAQQPVPLTRRGS